MMIVASEESWVEYSVDGKEAKNIFLESGRKKVISALDSITIKVGNAGGVELVLDGKKQPALGEAGAVREKTFTFRQGR